MHDLGPFVVGLVLLVLASVFTLYVLYLGARLVSKAWYRSKQEYMELANRNGDGNGQA